MYGLGRYWDQKASAAIGIIKATKTLWKKASILLKTYFKSLEILEKAFKNN
jgi:hypothetical protein